MGEYTRDVPVISIEVSPKMSIHASPAIVIWSVELVPSITTRPFTILAGSLLNPALIRAITSAQVTADASPAPVVSITLTFSASILIL